MICEENIANVQFQYINGKKAKTVSKTIFYRQQKYFFYFNNVIIFVINVEQWPQRQD